jgi:hypothetical protein
VYIALIGAAAAIVLIPGSPLGLLTEGVQVLAGVLLPSATVFLLLLCNDRAVLGPWVNRRRTNLFTSAVIAVLITLSVVLTAAVLFPSITGRQMTAIMLGCAAVSVLTGAFLLARARRSPARELTAEAATIEGRDNWRMPPLATLSTPLLSRGRKIGLSALRAYLAIAMILVIVKIVQEALPH